MEKLKREEFDKVFRFRESKGEGLVNCLTCASVLDKDNKKISFCGHKERARKVQLAESSLFSPRDIASASVCDVYAAKPLPECIAVPNIPEKNAIVLDSQDKDILHADANCPYVIEELRLVKMGENKKASVNMFDLSDTVPGEVVGRELCEMPCCSSKLNYQTWRPDRYRQRTGIKPDGTEPKIFVKNGIVNHEKKVTMTYEEAEVAFDLNKFNSNDFKGSWWDAVHAAHAHLFKNCNELGSKPLSEAVNPVKVSSCRYHHILEHPYKNKDGNWEFWVYDERLFDREKHHKVPMRNLVNGIEGVFPCIDTEGIFSDLNENLRWSLGGFETYGILRPVEDNMGLPKGTSHFIDIRAISYNELSNWMSGVFGKGFCGEVRSEQ